VILAEYLLVVNKRSLPLYAVDHEKHAWPVHPDVEVVRHAAVAQDELGPRDAAIEDVGLDEPPEGPLLQVLDGELGVEDDLATGACQPVAELDVLDRRPVVGLVESAVVLTPIKRSPIVIPKATPSPKTLSAFISVRPSFVDE